ncbi:hypothetical protein BA896_023335 [Janthinobacterium lividum]|uniref:Uncharacterized protein n=1 Tax=Janthinobacterium lividum TaxID=29581 RepID=A0A1E8PPD6_9BURK|nr:hypothetical protein BA896_023335 [Janthinobacterium lividum]
MSADAISRAFVFLAVQNLLDQDPLLMKLLCARCKAKSACKADEGNKQLLSNIEVASVGSVTSSADEANANNAGQKDQTAMHHIRGLGICLVRFLDCASNPDSMLGRTEMIFSTFSGLSHPLGPDFLMWISSSIFPLGKKISSVAGVAA